MGSGISITEEQAIDIMKREVERIFREKESSRCIVSDDGALVYEDFRNEIEFRQKIAYLNDLQGSCRSRRIYRKAENYADSRSFQQRESENSTKLAEEYSTSQHK